MNKRKFLSGASAVGAVLLTPRGARAQARPSRDRLNLLIITVDDMDWSLPGFISGRRNFTPNLDALAARSHRFINNRAVAPICQPSRQAMMTGLVPHRSGGIGFTPVKEGTPTLTSLLLEAGYYAAGIHKLEHMQPASCFPWTFSQGSQDRNPQVYGDGVELAILEAAGQGKPFFINCNINDPHRPFYGSPDAAEMDHGQQGPYKIAREIRPEEVDVPSFLEDLPDVRVELAQYWNSVQRLDASVGRITQALQTSGNADSTITVFCSDHGMPFPFAKATCYDSGTRVPVLISWPGMGAPRTFPNLTANIDIMPTALELLGVPAPAGIDGRSWVPIMRGARAEEPECVVTHVNTISSGMSYPMRAVQDLSYSLVFMPWADGTLDFRIESMTGLTFPAMAEAANGDARLAARIRQFVKGVPLAFYDLRNDPGQRVNLIEAPRHRRRVARMKDYLLRDMERTGDPQLENFRLLLAGRQPVVPQDPARYRMQGFGGG